MSQQTVGLGSAPNDGTGDALRTGGTKINANFLELYTALATSAGLAAMISDETGSGSLVFATSPTLVTPVLGVASATSINKVAITAPASSATLTVADGKTLTASNSLTLAGTDATTMTFPSTSQSIPGLGVNNVFTIGQTITQGTANAVILTSTGYSVTGSNTTSLIDLAGTWNTSGAPAAIKLDITNTQSGTAATLIRLSVGGNTRFSVGIGGSTNFLSGSNFTTAATARQVLAGESSNNDSFKMAMGYYLQSGTTWTGVLQATASGGAPLLVNPGGGSVVNGAALATDATSGFIYIPGGSGAPSGTPVAFAGSYALYWDHTNKQLYVYDGAWLQPKTPAAAALVNWQ